MPSQYLKSQAYRLSTRFFSILLLGLGTVTSLSTYADDKPLRWFEVEVILFTRNIDPSSIKEQFPLVPTPIYHSRPRDLLTRFHYPNIASYINQLPACHPWIDETPVQEDAIPMLFPRVAAQRTTTPSPWHSDYEQTRRNTIFCREDEEFDPLTRMNRFLPDESAIDFEHFDYEELPRRVNWPEGDDSVVHLLSSDSLKLNDAYKTLRNTRDYRPILHVGWRQPGLIERYARPTRLYAGKNYTNIFDFYGYPVEPSHLLPSVDDTSAETGSQLTGVPQENASSDPVQNNILQLLEQLEQGAVITNNRLTAVEKPDNKDKAKLPDKIWEIDGLFKIFMRGRYLNIAAEFNVRVPGQSPEAISFSQLQSSEQAQFSTQELLPSLDGNNNQQDELANSFLYTYNFKQTRRVITKETHYFDHPFMGMIVQTRRYKW